MVQFWSSKFLSPSLQLPIHPSSIVRCTYPLNSPINHFTHNPKQKHNNYFTEYGYLACARCTSTGSLVLIEPVSTLNSGDQPLSPPKTERCSNCSGAGKVMCPTCLCTGMAMASEHDPRIDPFD